MSEIEEENVHMRKLLERSGFRRCDIAACNCNSWHQVGGFYARFQEIDEATEGDRKNGETLLTRVNRIVADRDRLAEELAEVKAERDIFREERSAAWAQLEAWKRGELQTAEHALRDLRMEDELSAARADAERYRWLRDKASTSDLHSVAVRPSAEIDAAIDAARATDSAGGPQS